MNQLEGTLRDAFGKLPSLPTSIKDLIVKLAPFVALVAFIVNLPVLLIYLGIGGLATTIQEAAGRFAVIGYGTIGTVFSVALLALEGLSIPGLFSRTMAGWRYAYWAVLVQGLSTLLTGSLMAFVINTGIALYVLFQVRSSYR